MKEKFKIIISSNDFGRLISRILIILNQRNINIFYINVIYKEKKIIYSTIVIESNQEYIKKIIKQIKKQIGIISINYNKDIPKF